MTFKPASPEAVRLFHEGNLALAQIEHNGIRVDTTYLETALRETGERITDLEKRLRADPVFNTWRREYGEKTNLGSRQQLAHLLFKKLGFKCESKTATNRDKADEQAIKKTGLPFALDYLKLEKLKKMRGTYLKGFVDETVGGYMHPSFNLNTARTFRSSCTSPNWQNIPVRNPEVARVIRSCFVPRPGRHFVEMDFCVTGDTIIETIDGKQSIRDVIARKNGGDRVFVYGYDRTHERIAVSEVVAGMKTGRSKPVLKVTLDSGEFVKVTPGHKFLRRDGSFVEAEKLLPGTSLMPFYKTVKKSPWGTNYSKIYMNNGQSMLAHNLIASDVLGVQISGSDLVVHHKNGKGTDNSLANLEVMNRSDHMRIHVRQSWDTPKKVRDYAYQRSEQNRAAMRKRMEDRKKEWGHEEWEEWGQRIREGIKRKGGRAGEKNNMYGRKQTEETKKKISEAKTGVKTGRSWNKGLTKETNASVKKISDSKKGKPSPFKGKKTRPLSEECKRKISKSLKGRVVTEETKRKLSRSTREAWKSRSGESCCICGKYFKNLSDSHLRCRHGIGSKEYREKYNHKVASVEYVGEEDVYNITVEGIHTYAVGAGVIVKNCGIEVKIAACYHRDPTMLRYINDPSTDMHRDMAMECYLLAKEQVSKESRYCAKNMFVFPQFYGSFYVDCARSMWNAIDQMGLKAGDVPLKEHLKSKGIHSLGDCNPSQKPKRGTFEHHIQQVENDFWQRRFPVYARWKRSWWERYLGEGGFYTKTGFRIEGVYKRNEVINYPVQGASFHCLLWSLIEVQRILNRRKMKSLLIGQIHDSLIADAPPEELDDFLHLAKEVMTKRLLEAWKWIIVPLDIEAEVSPVDQSWFHKQKVKVS